MGLATCVNCGKKIDPTRIDGCKCGPEHRLPLYDVVPGPLTMVAGAQSAKTVSPPAEKMDIMQRAQLIEMATTIAAGIRASDEFETVEGCEKCDGEDEDSVPNESASKAVARIAVMDARNIIAEIDDE
ncbi:MAG: hypothetical protein IH987_05215 [Planctomycetes bacterium]|nr:hypothetical protein [Planctomycetota bacterium]